MMLSAIAANAQTKFFEKTTYIGAFGATNWTAGWSNFDPNNAVYGATTATLAGDITSNMTLDATKVYLISGFVYVKSGAVLTIPAGTVLRGDKATKATIIVTKGSKLEAKGTAAQPVIFTSNQAAGSRDYGDWGGVILLGNAPINPTGGTATIEGGVNNANNDGAYGGTSAADNSGIMTYCRLEFGGVAFQPDNEINGLTLGGVGSGTKLSHIQVSYAGDDAIEWFGGTVDADHLITFRTWDDDYDTDFGFSGRVQFGVALRDPKIADKSGSNGFESDNDGTGSDNGPFTSAVFSNMTIIGPGANADLTNAATFNANFKRGMHLRRNSRENVFNSVIIGYPVGILLDGSKTVGAINAGTIDFKSIILACNKKSLDTVSSRVAFPNFDITTWFNTAGYNNSIKTNCTDVMLGSYALTSPNFLPQTGSPLLSTPVDFNNAKLQPLNTAGVNEITLENAKLSIYPNPASSEISLSFDADYASKATISIIDVTGKVIATQSIDLNAGSNVQTINTAEISNGLYLVVLSANGKTASARVIVSK